MRGSFRTLSRLVAPAAALLLGACAAAPSQPAAPPVASFAYAPVAQAALVYEVADTADFSMQFGDIAFGSTGTVRVDVADADTALTLTARVVDFQGGFTGPTGTVRADESGVTGPFVFTISRKGEVLGRDLPEMTPAFEQVARSGDPIRALILQLPEGPIARGTPWTDTVVVEETTSDAAQVDNRVIVTSTWTRDTVVAGTTLRVIESTAENQVHTRAKSGGMDVETRLSGTTRATALWDPARQILVSRSAVGTLGGTVDVPAAGLSGIPMNATIKATAVLQGS